MFYLACKIAAITNKQERIHFVDHGIQLIERLTVRSGKQMYSHRLEGYHVVSSGHPIGSLDRV